MTWEFIDISAFRADGRGEALAQTEAGAVWLWLELVPLALHFAMLDG